MTDFSERTARIQIKDQIDRMKRKKVQDEYEWSGSDEGGDSLEQPTIKKGGQIRLTHSLAHSHTHVLSLLRSHHSLTHPLTPSLTHFLCLTLCLQYSQIHYMFKLISFSLIMTTSDSGMTASHRVGVVECVCICHQT